MSDTQGQQGGGYGYEEGGNGSSLAYGLNTGDIKLVKFEYTLNGGKDGAEAEAVDIVFNINGTEKGYRQFPVVKAFNGDQGEVTDPKHPKFIEAVKELSARLTHIVGVFVPKEDIQAALSQPVKSFKDYILILQKLLPKDYSTINLDIFLGYQWQISGTATKTFLEIPKKMTSGRWLSKAVAPVEGPWTEERKDETLVGDSDLALRYVDGAGNMHPFNRNGWYIKSNYSHQQKEADSGEGAAMNNAGSETPKKKW